ncbi:MAG: magnesium-translocating P-type ATPase, partial [Actinomycetota bacterium]
RSPILILLVAAALLSQLLGETTDAVIITHIVLASGVLGFFQERGAVHAVNSLLASVQVRCRVVRDGATVNAPILSVVRGDVVLLSAGDVVPGDCRVLEANNLLVDESTLTGEAYPAAKVVTAVPADAELADRDSVVHLGSHVASGTGTVVVVDTGAATEFGAVSAHLATRHVPTSFERGVTSFGLLLLRATAVLVVGVFVANIALDRPFVEALLFALALAVGLTPQMLPAIVTLSLSRGAALMAARRVIVKRLDAIEDIGGLDVLCTDKTGTLTSGSVGMDASLSPTGEPDPHVGRLAWLNARHQTGFANPIDDAILASVPAPEDAGERLAELPYDFTRKRLSVLVRDADGTHIITKGAFEQVLQCCSTIAGAPLPEADPALRTLYERLSAEGYRVLAVAVGVVTDRRPDAGVMLDPAHERALDLVGLLIFSDPAKAGAREAIERLHGLNVSVRLITGDNRLAAAHIATQMGLSLDDALTGSDIARLDDAALAVRADRTMVFAEVTPIHKERIVRALSAAGHTVGFLGDGINDAPALHVADVGISVDTAVDVAKQTADLVLLEKDLGVLGDGIEAGRRVFANTLKYVHVTTSANFGNMLSMAAAAAFLPFLPLLPTQILLLNFLSDVPATTIATDRVDDEQLRRASRWDVRQVRNFMIVFGMVSTVFDLLTFALLRWWLKAEPEVFRSGWFIESTATELAVMLVLRTRRPFLRSRPSRALAVSSAAVLAIVTVLPFTPLAHGLGLGRLSLAALAALVAVVVAYVVVTEALKQRTSFLFDSGQPHRHHHRLHRHPSLTATRN